jgi:G3E family GTPase
MNGAPKGPDPLRSPGVTILAGFLGAGKTTLLNAILQQADRRFAVIVNDFGAVNIDARLVADIEGTADEVELSNGCICCSIRGDLLMAVARLCERPNPPEHILIETSGVSDPGVVARTFLQPGIDALARLEAIVVAVDPESYPELTGSDWRLARRQVAVADLVVMTKDDLVGAGRRAMVKALIHRDVPQARLVRSSRDYVPVELILGTIEATALARHRALGSGDVLEIHVHEAEAEHHGHEHDHGLAYSTWCFRSDTPLSPRKLRRALQQLPPEVFRIKGIVALGNRPDDRIVLQVVGRRAELYVDGAWGTDSPHSEIVVIGRAGSLRSAWLAELFQGCTHAPGEGSEGFFGEMLGYFSRLLGGTSSVGMG